MPTPQWFGQIDFDAVRCLSLPLAEKLEAYAELDVKNQRAISLLYANIVDRLIAADAGQKALTAGAPLPSFILPDSDGRLVGSDDLLESGPLVVSFYRGHWCPYCRFELLALADIYPEIKKLGGDLVSITPEKAEFAGNLRKTYDLPFCVLSDIDNGYALANGLMISVGDDLRQALLERGVDLSVLQGNVGLFMPIPATYVVAGDGVVKTAYVNPDYRQRMSPDRIISALQDL